MNLTSAEFPPEASEFEAAGLTPSPSSKVAPPWVKESPIQMECELIQIVEVGQGALASNLVIADSVEETTAEPQKSSALNGPPCKRSAIVRVH